MSDLARFKDITHPFDEENHVEIEQLFTFFCNCLTLGQWELARVCLRDLFQKQKKLGKPFKDVVRAVIDQPHVCSHGSPSVQSPFHLSWLCLVEYLDLFTNEEDLLPQLICSNVEFRLLLYTACRNAPKQVIQDLDNYHCKIVYRDPELFSSEVSELSSSILNYLKSLLSENVQLSHAVIVQLTGEGRLYLKNNQTLQSLYIEAIERHLEAVDVYIASKCVHGAPVTTTGDEFSLEALYEQEYSCVYDLLSLMDPTSEMLDLSPVLDQLFENLIKRTKLKKHKHLDIGKLYNCFIGRTTTYLITKFSDVENRLRLPSSVGCGLDVQLPMGSSQRYREQICLSPTVQISFFQSFTENRQEAWKLLFFHAMSGKHILENVVETALLFVKDGDFDRMTQLLAPQEFAVLKPLVLLLGWPYCYSCENARSLLAALWQPKVKLSHPLLDQACQKLAYQVQLVQWCLQRAGPLLASSDGGSTSHQQASDMFQGLESQSVLRVLHRSTNLARLPEKEVFELLKKRPVFYTSVDSSSSFSTLDSSAQALETGNDDVPAESVCTELHPEIQRDIVLYHSFLAMRYFMKAVTSSLSVDKGPSEPDESHEKPKIDVDENSQGGEVTRCIEEGLNHLNQVYPLTYRVEIIENIFSLLFTTYEDLYDCSQTHLNHESDGQESGECDTKSLSKSSRTGSIESLASLTSEISVDMQSQYSSWREQEHKSPDLVLKPVESSRQTILSDLSRRRLFQKDRIDLEGMPLAESRKNEKLSLTNQGNFETVRTKSGTTGGGSSALTSELESPSNDPHVGFIASEQAAQAILKTLKESLVAVNAEKFRESRKDVTKQDVRWSSDWVRTGVLSGTLEQHLSRLSQYINEAQWRLQLVTWNEREREEMMRGARGRRKSRKFHQKMASGSGSDWIVGSQGDVESDEDEQADKPKSKFRKPVGGATELEDRSGESASSPYLSQDFTTGTENGGGAMLVKKRATRRHKVSARTSESGLVVKDDTVIARMLASPDTLIYMCMRKDNYDRAQQVVKMFNIKDKPSSQSAVFAEQYEGMVKKLASLQPRGRRTLDCQGGVKGKSALGAVAMAAAVGVTRSDVSNLIDKLLTSPALPAGLSGHGEEDLTPTKFALAKFLLPSLIPTMICLDLACTVANTRQMCKTLLDMAKGRLTEETESSITPEPSLVGIVPFLNQMRRLLGPEDKKRGNFSFQSGTTAIDMLQMGSDPLNPTLLDRHRKFLTEHDEIIAKMEAALDDGDSVLRSVDVSAQSNQSKQQSHALSCSKVERSMCVRTAMVEFLKVFNVVEMASYHVTTVGCSKSERYDYVRSLVNHVDALATLILYWQHSSESEPEGTNEAEKFRLGNMKSSNPFVVMNEALAENLGRPMFEKNVAPRRPPGGIKKLTWKKVNQMYGKGHENILSVIDLMLTLPAFSAEVERGFSQLKLLKTDMRSTLKEYHLNDLMTIKLLSAPINEFDPAEAIELWNKGGVYLKRPMREDKGHKGNRKRSTGSIVALAVESSSTSGKADSADAAEEIAHEIQEIYDSEPDDTMANEEESSTTVTADDTFRSISDDGAVEEGNPDDDDGAGEEGNPDDDAYEHEVQEAAACYSDEDLDEIDSPDKADSADEDTVDRMIVKYCRWPSSNVVVLNTSEQWTESARDPNVVAKELLTKMVDLLRGIAATHGGTVNSLAAPLAVRSPEFQAIVQGSQELQRVDLDLLHSNTSKICFFTNVLNLLLAHATLSQFCGSSANSRDQEREFQAPVARHVSLNKLDSGSTCGLELRGGSTIPVTALGRIAFLKRHCYHIGQLGVISAFDLKYVVLHSGLPPPTTFGCAITQCFPERTLGDPKRRYRPQIPEQRVLFAVCGGCLSSPTLQVFDVDELDTQLTTAAVQYVNSNVVLIPENGQVVLPELIKWYRKDYETVALDDTASSSHDQRQDPNTLLLLQLEPFLYTDTATKLQQMLPHIKEVSFSPFSWKLGYRFDINVLETSTSSSNLQSSSSAPDSLYQSTELESSVVSRKSLDNRGKYNVNRSILDYLEKSSPLTAALVSLVCPLPTENTDTLTVKREQPIVKKASGGKSIAQEKVKGDFVEKLQDELPFKAMLQRISKFKPLQRYLVARLYPIAELVSESVQESYTTRSFSHSSYEFIRLDSKYQKPIETPKIPLFPLTLSSEGQEDFQKAFVRGSDFYFREGNLEHLLEIISYSDLLGNGSSGSRIDFLFTSAILSRGGMSQLNRLDVVLNELGIPEMGRSHKWQERPWSLLPQIQDNDQLAELVLSSMHQWKAIVCLDVLSLCLSRLPENSALTTELQRRRKEITLYQKIVHCAKSFQVRPSDPDSRDRSYSLLTQWQGVSSASQAEPETIVELLSSIQQYELAKDWAEMHSLPKSLFQTIQESHLKHLLESSPGSDSMKAYRILESMSDKEMTLTICNSLLKQNLHVSQTLFLIQFMLINLHDHLSPIRTSQLLCTKIGAKALLCLPEVSRPNYEHLVSRPLLLLEQLLMNMKVEWAVSVFRHLQDDLNSLEDSECSQADCLSVKAFDDLLTSYASKALEFQIIHTEASHDDSVSISDNLSQTLSASPSPSIMATFGGHVTPVPSSSRQMPSATTPIKESSDQTSLAGSPDRRGRKTPGHSRNPSLGRKVSVEEMQRGSLKRMTGVNDGQLTYVPPSVPPKREDWIRDEQVSSCMVCHEQFSMFNRRHHCRRCGRVVCGLCSPHSCVVEGFDKTPVRVCSTCYERFYSTRPSVPTQMGTPPIPDSLERCLGIQGQTGSPEKGMVGSFLGDLWTADLQTEDFSVPYQWQLTLDKESNAVVREEFFYEQAPSSSLCIAILDLHSDTKVCGRFILDLANTLSQKLVPITPGVINEEVDHNLVIGIIRYLLFNAKLKLLKAGDTSGFELCDTYLGHVELMKFLVESNCGDIPSLQQLMHPESARRLRDRFIEDERLNLAIEVSTKCGLEPSPVWAAAGFAQLHAGDFTAARDKFSRCLKPIDSKQQQQQNSRYLDKIIDIIQSSPLIPYQQSTEALLAPLAGLVEHSKNAASTSFLDSTRYDECLYYLNTYGTPASTVAFYIKHGDLKLACRYVLDKKCPSEVFVESLLMRLISKGQSSHLKEQMETADPTLQSWKEHLTAACRYLHRRGYHNVLYEMQLFMKDYFRAAQTCIRFYEGSAGGGVSSYEGLHSRLPFLVKAKSHIETVIAERKTPKGSMAAAGASLLRRSHSLPGKSSSAEDMANMTLTVSELNSYLNTINLQMEVTHFVHSCLSESGGVSGVKEGKDGRLPTLFGNPQIRGEVAAQVLLSGASVQDGFSLACRIIQDFNLPAARVYVDTGRVLARRYKYVHIQQLLRCVGETGQVDDKCYDDIILACVRIVSADQSQSKQCETLVKLLNSDTNKINAFMMCGKLKSAYLTAVKQERADVIRKIAEAASKTGQVKMVEICNKWLAQHQRRQEAQQRIGNQQRRSLDPSR